MGGNGAFLLDDLGAMHIPAFKVEAVDPTGAGDAFAAGYLLALARQASLGECVAQAQAVAARDVGRAGATLEDE